MSDQKEKIIVALLTQPTVKEAASSVNVSERTIYRMLKEDGFQEEYRSAKREVVGQAIARLQQISSEAADALREVYMDKGNPASSRVSAAKCVLEMSLRALELEQLEERIEALEERITN